MDARKHEGDLVSRAREDDPRGDRLFVRVHREVVFEVGGLLGDPRLEERLEGLKGIDACALGLECLELQQESHCDDENKEAEHRGIDHRGVEP